MTVNTREAMGGGLAVLGCIALLLAVGCSGSPDPAGKDTLTVADGFEVEIAAGPPLVERPMIVDMDEQGRLYVAESSGSNDPVQQQLAEKPHSILRLEDVDGDGRYDRRTVFADGMMLPEGVLWHAGSLYVAAPPSIWKLTDSDGDGIADRREEWFQGKTLTNCANDLHGPYLGVDGWIYWTKGAFAEQTYERPGRQPLVTKAAHVFRRRPHGGPVEAVLTGGMDNPVEVAFSPEGERFLTATFLQHPELGRRDGLIHAIYGGVYGKVHGVYDNHPQAGGLLEPMTHLGPAAPVGLSYYESGVFGQGYQGNLFVTLFNLNKVTRHALVPEGATFRTEDEDFLVSTSTDFHPTDVMEDADGSLLVVDTGPWYKLCCPTSQLAKPDLPGAIYRIRKQGAKPPKSPRGSEYDWERATSTELTALLDDPRPMVRKRAIAKLADREAVAEASEVLNHGTVQARINALWVLTRIESDEARAQVRRALADKDAGVRQAAAHGTGVWRDPKAQGRLISIVTSDDPAVRRAAAEALGRLGNAEAVPVLLTAAQTKDPTLWHSLTYALIEIGDVRATRDGLTAQTVGTRRAALISLGEMETGGIDAKTAVPLLSSSNPEIREAAAWVVGRHIEWGASLAGHLRQQLAAASQSEASLDRLEQQLALFSGDAAVQKLLAQTVLHGSEAARSVALRAMARSPVKQAPPEWAAALAAALQSQVQSILSEAVNAAHAVRLSEADMGPVRGALADVGSQEKVPSKVRTQALEAAAKLGHRLNPVAFRYLLEQLADNRPAAVRRSAARALAQADLTEEQKAELTGALRDAGALELPLLVGAYADGGDVRVGNLLLKALEQSRARGSLRPELVERALANFPEEVRADSERLVAMLDADRRGQKEHLEQLLVTLQAGDVRRGQAVFNNEKTACRSCHQIGSLGGRVGPDLTRISEIRTRRDLLEAVVYPSASFVRSYEPLIVETEHDVHNGIVLEETEQFLLLATGAEEQIRIPRDEVLEVRPGHVSVMPDGLEDEITGQELADLITFLERTKWGPQ